MENMTSLRASDLGVYSFNSYDRSGKVRWLLEELGIEYKSHMLDTEKKQHEDPAFLRLNPMGRVPVLEFKGQGIFESGAICAYVADLYLEKGLAPKLDSPDRAKYQQWMYFASSTLDTIQTKVMIIEDIPPGEVHMAKLASLQTELRDALTALDHALEASPFLVGNRFTAADICVSYHLVWLPLWPELEAVVKDFPRAIEYVARMKARPKAIAVGVFAYEG